MVWDAVNKCVAHTHTHSQGSAPCPRYQTRGKLYVPWGRASWDRQQASSLTSGQRGKLRLRADLGLSKGTW